MLLDFRESKKVVEDFVSGEFKKKVFFCFHFRDQRDLIYGTGLQV